MGLLKLEDIRAAKLRTEAVEVPEWSGTVLVREWSAGELLTYNAWSAELESSENLLHLVAQLLVNEDGSQVFANVTDGVSVLRNKHHTAITRLAQAVMRINKLADDETGALAKNSETSLSAVSRSGSPMDSE